jgi:hypothetical protein
MPVFYNDTLCYLHIPKCGGLSVTDAARRDSLDTLSLDTSGATGSRDHRLVISGQQTSSSLSADRSTVSRKFLLQSAIR